MRAPELFCLQQGILPVGSPSKDQTVCVFCGKQIKTGELCSRILPGDTFMDGPELCARDSARNIVCGFCVHLTGKKVMLNTQHVCITREHVLPMRQLAHKKWILLHPPEPPFVIVQSDAPLAHMLWRTPVTISKDLWYVRVGKRQLIVRMAFVKEALRRFEAVATRYADARPARKEREQQLVRSPFVLLGYELDDLVLWRLRSDVRPYVEPDDVNLINKLRPGEYWALAILTTTKAARNPLNA